MFLFYICLLSLVLIGASFKWNGFYEDGMGKEQCNAIKGIFIILIFFSHISRYLVDNGYHSYDMLDSMFIAISTHIGQWVVAVFLFYSGYGVMESLKIKNKSYLESFPRKRILTTLMNFDVAVLVFILLSLLIGNTLSLGHIMLSFIGWSSVGNSNWYIFVILICYLAFYVSYRLNDKWGKYVLLVLLVSIMMILSQTKEYRWYNTILCFPAGVFYSNNHTVMKDFFHKHYYIVLISLLVLFVVFCYLGLPRIIGFTYNVGCVCFVLTIVLISMRVRLRNKLLMWFGINLFPLYIYQRLPMITLKQWLGTSWICSHPFIYTVTCLGVTMIICYFYRFWRISFR